MSNDDENNSGGKRSHGGRGKIKGRGIARMDDDRYEGRGGIFETIEQSSDNGPAQCM
jgi:hypothetical protein